MAKKKPSRLDSAAYAWYAVVTPPQKEFVAEKVLANEGFATFLPTRKEWRFRNKIARMKRQKHEVTYALMPRYVFIGMSEGTPGWERVVCFPKQLVQYVIFEAGEPWEVPHDKRPVKKRDGRVLRYRPGLRELMDRFNRGQFNAPGSHRYMQTHREFAEGDKVLTDDGLFVGRVLEISDNRARVLVELFGGEREVITELEKLVAAE